MSDRKKIAAVITTYYPRSHADVLLGKFLEGFPTDDGHVDPRVDVASVYMDQRHKDDMCYGLSEKHGFRMCESIREAMILDEKELAVDGVLIVGEHGDYPWNRREQHLYPRKYFFEQVTGVFEESGRSVPVFSDKHLSWNWHDAKWMADQASELDFAFMAGSSIPYSWRSPWVEFDKGTLFEGATAVGYGGNESYGFHMLEGLQCMVERRKGAETGVEAVQCLEGEEAWKAAGDGLWNADLAEAACSQVPDMTDEPMREKSENPCVFLVDYQDGFNAAAVMLHGYSRSFGFGAQVGGETVSFDYVLKNGEPWSHFSYLGLNIEEMFITCKPSMAYERTLLVTGMLEAAMISRHEGHRRVETPHLNVAYESYNELPYHPRKEKPEGASVGKEEGDES
ncbi:MAG: hypothetical protein QF437_02540 [Planctomycetota bacterium]|jgi:hypothetical protein|nr:hypothetical protein [Planctomycetota bacterium]MDP7249722.1 hypothetical protein [Planctomycetota bacterium]